MTITTTPRPYLLLSGGMSFLLTSDEAQRLIDASAPVPELCSVRTATLSDGHGGRYTVVPATLGGGDAFSIDRR